MSKGHIPNSIRIATQKLLRSPKYQIEKQFTPQLAMIPDVPYREYWYKSSAKGTKLENKSKPRPGGNVGNCSQNRQVASRIEATMETGRNIFTCFAAASFDNSNWAGMANRATRRVKKIPWTGLSSVMDFVREPSSQPSNRTMATKPMVINVPKSNLCLTMFLRTPCSETRVAFRICFCSTMSPL